MEIQIEQIKLTLYVRDILVGLMIAGFISRWFQSFR